MDSNVIFNIEHLNERLKIGVEFLSKYDFIRINPNGIEVKAEQGDKTVLCKSAKEISVTYDTELRFYMALARSIGADDGVYEITPQFQRLGFMLDCSRNAVPKTEKFKQLICFLVMAGYDYLEIYTEDIYRMADEPYFGYARGRYSVEELKEIIAFADVFGMEVVPCIQTLAHLGSLKNWKLYAEHMDIDDILLTKDERTTALIRKMLRFCKDVFHTERINIGLDEAFNIGRGKYRDIHGDKFHCQVYREHAKHVFDLCKEEGLKPEFWGDGMDAQGTTDDYVKSLFDGDQTPICWSYGIDPNLERIMKYMKWYSGNCIYCGGVWNWIGYTPHNKFAIRALDRNMNVAKECGIDHVLITAWGDNGAECSPFAVIPVIWFAGEKTYPIEADRNQILEALTGYSSDEWLVCDTLDEVMPNSERLCNVSKYALHNDFLIGLLDVNIPEHAGDKYRQLLPRFEELAKRNSPYAYLFRSYAALCRVLVLKSTYSKRLYKAYQQKDRVEMNALLGELSQIREDLKQFYSSFRKLWMKENKGYGFEVMDVRIGGLISRVDTVALVLEEYLSGATECIYELEEDRLDYFCGVNQEDDIYTPLQNFWRTIYTVNNI